MNKRIKMNRIEQKLSTLLEHMNYVDYVSFINDNDLLKSYDEMAGKIDIHYYPSTFSVLFTDNVLDNVEDLIDIKIKELSL